MQRRAAPTTRRLQRSKKPGALRIGRNKFGPLLLPRINFDFGDINSMAICMTKDVSFYWQATLSRIHTTQQFTSLAVCVFIKSCSTMEHFCQATSERAPKYLFVVRIFTRCLRIFLHEGAADFAHRLLVHSNEKEFSAL